MSVTLGKCQACWQTGGESGGVGKGDWSSIDITVPAKVKQDLWGRWKGRRGGLKTFNPLLR